MALHPYQVFGPPRRLALGRAKPRVFSNPLPPASVPIARLFSQILDTLRPAHGWHARLSTEIILAQTMGISRLQVYVDGSQRISPEQMIELERKLALISNGSSPATLSGRVRFFDTVLEVETAVFIPRPETENLVEVLREIISDRCGTAETPIPLRMLDLCTGAGNIPIAITRALPQFVLLEINATDISREAVQLAEKNVRTTGYEASINIFQGDLFSAEGLLPETYDIISANPPYYTTNEARRFAQEPLIALDGGEDGLFIIRQIIAEAPKFLNANGVLVMEINKNLTQKVLALFDANPQWKKRAPVEITRGESVVIVASVGQLEIPRTLISGKKTPTPLLDPAVNWDRSLFRFLSSILKDRILELDSVLGLISDGPEKAEVKNRMLQVKAACGLKMDENERMEGPDLNGNLFDIIQLHIEAIFLIDLATPQATRQDRYFFNMNFLRKKENYFGPIAYFATIFILMDQLGTIMTRNADLLTVFQRLPDPVKSLIRLDAVEELRSKAAAYIDIAKSFTVKRQNKFGERLSLTKQSNWYAITYGLYYYCREISALTEAMRKIEIHP